MIFLTKIVINVVTIPKTKSLELRLQENIDIKWDAKPFILLKSSSWLQQIFYIFLKVPQNPSWKSFKGAACSSMVTFSLACLKQLKSLRKCEYFGWREVRWMRWVAELHHAATQLEALRCHARTGRAVSLQTEPTASVSKMYPGSRNLLSVTIPSPVTRMYPHCFSFRHKYFVDYNLFLKKRSTSFRSSIFSRNICGVPRWFFSF